jgi:hypothetical protein
MKGGYTCALSSALAGAAHSADCSIRQKLLSRDCRLSLLVEGADSFKVIFVRVLASWPTPAGARRHWRL